MARVYGGGFYNRALDFEQGRGIAEARDDDDQASAYESTVWEAVGDWEGGNMTPVPLSAEGGEASSFEAATAVLWEMYAPQRSASDDSEVHETDAAAVDWLLMESGQGR
jgi:hypothetical protein